jgi:hypothetical protein
VTRGLKERPPPPAHTHTGNRERSGRALATSGKVVTRLCWRESAQCVAVCVAAVGRCTRACVRARRTPSRGRQISVCSSVRPSFLKAVSLGMVSTTVCLSWCPLCASLSVFLGVSTIFSLNLRVSFSDPQQARIAPPSRVRLGDDGRGAQLASPGWGLPQRGAVSPGRGPRVLSRLESSKKSSPTPNSGSGVGGAGRSKSHRN